MPVLYAESLVFLYEITWLVSNAFVLGIAILIVCNLTIYQPVL